MNNFILFFQKILNLVVIKLERFAVNFLKKNSTKSFFCPICKTFSYSFDPKVNLFKNEGPRKNEKCPKCKSFKRHRFIYCFLEHQGLLDISNLRVLHIAPERCFLKTFEKMWGKNYITADLNAKNVKMEMDITKVQIKDETFDFILCNHVLEHIEDDKRALSELFRLLKKGGKVVVTVPISGEKTFEDFKIKDPKERLKYFGQKDHVRKYGLDIVKKLAKVGFEVKIITPIDIMNKSGIKKYAINPKERVFFCFKK